jgi:hypothetical protein
MRFGSQRRWDLGALCWARCRLNRGQNGFLGVQAGFIAICCGWSYTAGYRTCQDLSGFGRGERISCGRLWDRPHFTDLLPHG